MLLMKENRAINYNEVPDTQSEEQLSLRLKNSVEFAKFSFELEEKREQSLINQSGQMLTAFSIASAVILMAVPILIEFKKDVAEKTLISAGIVLALMIASMVLAVLSQWRFKYTTMMNGDELLTKVEADADNHTNQMHYDYQWIDQLKEIQNSKKKNNDKRYKLIHASMIIFLIAIAALFVCTLVLCIVK